uniref:Cullin-associated and neddylation-dissociated 1 n=1 Tax=Sphaeramia orbicularis TaxID=375764 RepID=A0A673A1E2_9TELE
MASASYHISNLLEKMTSSDKDFRFMATNDLMTELQKDSIKLDDDSERKVVRMILKLLEDKNGEVQNLAVKCLGPLVSKVKEYQVETIVDTLCTNMLSDKEQLRDISSIGLKTVIGELPPASSGSALAASVCKKITGRLTSAIAKQEDVSVQLEALDIMADMLCRYLGGLLVNFHPSILSCLLPQLTSPRLAVRKRTIMALGHLVMSCGNLVFIDLIEHLLTELGRNDNMSTTRTYIQCTAAISRQAGHRIGEYLEKIIPLVVKFCNVDDDELREYCIQAFESFVRRCPKEVYQHVPTIISICLRYLTYDPNYNFDDEDEDDNAMDAEQNDEDYQGSDDEYSDDDDMSWKVRRAAAKCLDAVVSTRHEMLPEFYRSVSPALVCRFKEREENVKADVFHAYLSLLKQTRPAQSWLADPDAMEQGDTPLTMLQSQVPMIVKALHKQLKEKSVKTRQCCFNMLTELVNVLPGALTQHIPVLIPGIIFSLNDKSSSSNLKIDALACLHVIMVTHPAHAFHAHVPALVPPVVACVGDPFYKITSEALLVTQQLVKVIRPLDNQSEGSDSFDPSPYINDLFTCTIRRLKAADIDQEVKERAISCMGQIICNLGDRLPTELPGTLLIFLERLKNEITRLTTVKALTMIAGSPLKIDLRPVLPDAVPILASFLRKNQRALKLCTLAALDILLRNYSSAVTPVMVDAVLAELPPLISESDMHVSQMALSFLSTLAVTHPSSLGQLSGGNILQQLIALVRSPLLQGGALAAMLDFYQVKGRMGFMFLDQYRVAPSAALPHKQAYCSIAKCVAALTRACPTEGPAVVGQFIQVTYLSDVKNSRSTDSIRLLALLSLGEVGHHVDLSSQPELKTVILDAFSSSSEEVKSAASYALGSIAVGNLPEYLPFVLQEISSSKRQYLLLHSLKEIISSASVSGLKPYVESVWSLLLKHCECQEEGTRNVVAECLGKLTLIDPETLLPRLKGYHLRGTATLEDPDLNVRRVALVTFNSAAHNKPSLIRELLDSVLPQLYNETKVRKELIREVEMGPFKHTVDDGLDLRKAAFECMYTLLDSCLDRLDIFTFLNHVEDGLKDHYDIKMLTFLMLARLSSLCPSAVLQRLDRLVEPLRATCTTKVHAYSLQNSVKQEFEKQDELKRSAMRAVVALLTIPEAEKSPLMSEFQSQISSNQELAAIFDSIQRDSSSANMESMDNQLKDDIFP